jgi:hypothetical protein
MFFVLIHHQRDGKSVPGAGEADYAVSCTISLMEVSPRRVLESGQVLCASSMMH